MVDVAETSFTDLGQGQCLYSSSKKVRGCTVGDFPFSSLLPPPPRIWPETLTTNPVEKGKPSLARVGTEDSLCSCTEDSLCSFKGHHHQPTGFRLAESFCLAKPSAAGQGHL